MALDYSHALLITGSRTWDDEVAMRRVFNEIWTDWAARGPITRPVLVSGHCPADKHGRSADAMAERLWRSASLHVIKIPADWKAHGKKAGLRRNVEMVNAVLRLCEAGTEARAAAFLDLCDKNGCPRANDEQLLPARRGHFSHGTVHCRRVAMAAGISVVDVACA
ncbi:DUF2493 domain-containing protein [Nocardiopsis metallicus]|uniref:DUF2493 domain-containing protein n=1 Tax=Nocardiopsis metallicus TaxID=179819 RepID=A0A840W5Y5_9ACTN|nr:DUF2493 domain-containing protein [Nocardiopsis metallicus]MBB5491414.1 hypothetical protein [Nocardiopsis metallicus]